MSGEEGDGAEADTTETAQTESEAVAPEMIAEARKMGWSPKEKWRGNPDLWVDADEFVRKGREVLPIVNSQNAELRRELAEQSATIKRMERMNEQALEAQRQQLTAQFDAEKRAAVETGDTARYDKAEAGQKAALKTIDATKDAREAVTPEGGLPSKDQKIVASWVSDNPWMTDSRVLRAAADDHFDAVNKEMPYADMDDKLAEVKSLVMSDYPEKFGRAKTANGGSGKTVEGGSRVAGGGGKASLYSKLPAEAKAAADRFVKRGLFKSGEDYAKKYFEDA